MYIFVAVFVSAITMTVNALHKINCVTDCNSIGYTIYNILCNAFTFVVQRCTEVCRVTFGRQTDKVPGVRSPRNLSLYSLITQDRVCDNVERIPLAQRSRVDDQNAGTLPAPSIYPPLLLVYARWSLWGHKVWRNEHAIEPFKIDLLCRFL